MSQAILVENLGKKYSIRHLHQQGVRYKSLREVIGARARSLFHRGESGSAVSETEDFWALRDVSFEVEVGGVVGIIGRNGAGKSTLLKLLSRITEPTTGRMELEGRVSSLLEVGTGFHPELTGKENIYLNGAIMGMTRLEIKRKFDEIVAFAEVERFLDTPVKRYSSGMYMRLAFAVAAHLEPEILVVDEVLAVGDAQFQKKCLGKMGEVSREGRTVLFVSHNMAAIAQLTTRCVLLEKGRVRHTGPTEECVNLYLLSSETESETKFDVENAPRKVAGTQVSRILSFRFDRETPMFSPSEDFQFIARVRALEDVPRLRFSMTVFSSDGTAVGSCFGVETDGLRKGEEGDFCVRLPKHGLAPGHYYCGVAVGKGSHLTGHVDFDIVLDTMPFQIRPAEGDSGTVANWNKGWGFIVFPSLENLRKY